MSFDFQDKGELLDECVELSEKMHKFKDSDDLNENLIRHVHVLETFDKARISEMAALLADPANTLTFLTSQSFDESEFDKLEHYYQIKYSVEKYSDSLLKLMKEPTIKDNGKALGMPPVNHFIPTDFEVLAKNAELSKEPVLVKSSPESDLWYKKDDKFDRPKGIIGMKLYTADLEFGKSAKATMFASVWKACFEEFIREENYMAEIAELGFTVEVHDNYINFEWTGYSHTLPVLVQTTI
jgi:insulysin